MSDDAKLSTDRAREREQDDVYMRRYKEAERYGFRDGEATRFALDTSIDVGELRRLIRLGCPPKLAARILL